MIQRPNLIRRELDRKLAAADASMFRRIVEMARVDRALRIVNRYWKRQRLS